MLRHIWDWRKSMFAQMVLFTLLFLGWGLYVFVIRPTADIPTVMRTPSETTEERLRTTLHMFLVNQRDKPNETPNIDDDPLIRAIEARNPAFRFYARLGDQEFGNGSPTYFRQFKLDLLEQAHLGLDDLAICSQASKIIKRANYYDYAEFYMCNRLLYYEYHDLRRPVVLNQPVAFGTRAKWLAAFSGNFLLAASGVFLISALIFALHILSIRRVATLARSIDPRRLDAKLPEKRVATEVLPLVRAVNELIEQLDAAQRRATFFLSAAAHEMRTPLTVLRTRLELMDEGAQKEKLIGDVHRLTRLVNQLLTLMSIGNRRDVTGFADLVMVGRTVVKDLSMIAARTNVRLVFSSVNPIYEIPGDAMLIQSAISNLVDNAISFAPEGTEVEVRVGAGGTVSIRDHGPGLGCVDTESLFEPFIRPVSSRRGYGLGLAIVSAIVRLHGGHVAAANATEGGAIFTATFSSKTYF